MSSLDSNGQGESASRDHGSHSYFNYDSSNGDLQIEPSLMSAGGNPGGGYLLPAHSSEDMAHHPVGGYDNNIKSGHMGNTQSSFVPHTPGPSFARQLSGIGNASYSSSQNPQDNSLSIGNAPFTPGKHTAYESLNYESNSSGSLRPQRPNSLSRNMDQLLFTPKMGYAQSAYSTAAGNSMADLQDFTGMSFGDFKSPQGSRGPRGMQNTMNMDISSISQKYQGEQRFSVQNPSSYGSSGNGFDFGAGAGDFTFHSRGEYGLSDFQGQNQLSAGRSDSNQAFRNGQMMKRERPFGSDTGEQAYGLGTYSNQKDFTKRSELHQMHPDYVPDHGDDENYGQNGRFAYQNEESDGGVRIGRTSTSQSSSSNSGSGPSRNTSKFKATIKTEAEFMKIVADRISAVEKTLNKKSRKNAYPHTDEEKLECIGKLYDAIMNTDDKIVDKEAQDGRKAQAARRLDEGFYPPEVIEFACWEILRKCKQASKGDKLVPSHHFAKHEGKEDHTTFKDRWVAITKACLNSKAVCKQILDPSYVDRLVDAPFGQFKMKLNNKKINAERDKQNKLGRLAINAGVGETDLPAIVKQEDDEEVAVTPSKRSASRQRKSATKRRTPNYIKYEHDNEEDDREDNENGEDDDTFETPIKTKQPHSMAVSSRLIRTPHKRTPLKTTPSSSAKAMKPSPFPQPTAELDRLYRLTICQFLQVRPDNADKFDLDELRFFARAYNGPRQKERWYHESFTKGEYLLGHRLYFNNGKNWAHFCCSLPTLHHFATLAVQRGELNQNSSVIKDHQIAYYDVTNKLHLKQVLGIAPNAFGMKSYTQPPPYGPQTPQEQDA